MVTQFGGSRYHELDQTFVEHAGGLLGRWYALHKLAACGTEG